MGYHYNLIILNIIESYHRMAWVEKDHSDHPVSTSPALCRVTNHQTRLPRATSSLALNAARDGAFTTSLGNLFQCFTTLWVKNFLLISNLNLPCLSLKPFSLALSLSTLVNSCSPSWLYAPLSYWKRIFLFFQELENIFFFFLFYKNKSKGHR